jgi:hypothetical protein
MITVFNIGDNVGTITEQAIVVEVPFKTDVKYLIPEFYGEGILEARAFGLLQVSKSSTLDFTTPIVYTITLADNTTIDYTITVVVKPNTENRLITFDIPLLHVIGQIGDDTKVAMLNINEGQDLSKVYPVFSISENATCDLPIGQIVDLTVPLVVTVTSESGQVATYFITPVTAPNHINRSLTVYKMLLNRLPFIEDCERNKELLSELTYEVMVELEGCFNVSILPDGTIDQTRVGQERFYGINHKSIIADILAINTIMVTALRTIGGDKQSITKSEPATKFISNVQAGSVTVGYSQLSLNSTAIIGIDTVKSMELFKADVTRKMLKIGCAYEIPDTTQIVPYVGFITSGQAQYEF